MSGKRIAVIGGGPAGLTAAFSLARKGSDVVVFEKESCIGGRTRTNRFEEGHYVDTGAGWFTSSYTQSLKLFQEAGIHTDLVLRKRQIRGASDLFLRDAPDTLRQVDKDSVSPLPMRTDEIIASSLLTEEEKTKLVQFLKEVCEEETGNFDVEAGEDQSALEGLRHLGSNVLEYVMRPMFEGPFFAPLSDFSMRMVRAWLKVLCESCTFSVRLGVDVQSIQEGSGRRCLVYHHDSDATLDSFDGVVLAVPAPVVSTILSSSALSLVGECFNASTLSFFASVNYVPQVRLYVSRVCDEDANVGVHFVPPHEVIGTIEFFSGNRGAWGCCPNSRQWALICGSAEFSRRVFRDGIKKDEVVELLWGNAKGFLPSLFPLGDADVVDLHQWELAVPIIEREHYIHMSRYVRAPPIVVAGDWTLHACVEGAVRSGLLAAEALS